MRLSIMSQSRRGGKRKRHTPEQSTTKLREADAMLAGGKTIAQVVQYLGVSEQTLHRWPSAPRRPNPVTSRPQSPWLRPAGSHLSFSRSR